MMYLLTPEEHAQIVDALWVVVEHNRLHHGKSSNTVVQCASALAMLKAMKPRAPVAHLIQHDETGRTRYLESNDVYTDDGRWNRIGPLYLYAKEQQ